MHALYNHVGSYGGPDGASAARAWSRIADRLAGSASHKVPQGFRAHAPHASHIGGREITRAARGACA